MCNVVNRDFESYGVKIVGTKEINKQVYSIYIFRI